MKRYEYVQKHRILCLAVFVMSIFIFQGASLNAKPPPSLSDCYSDNGECGEWQSRHNYVRLENGCTIGVHYKLRECTAANPAQGDDDNYCELDFSYFYIPSPEEYCDACLSGYMIYTAAEIIDQVMEYLLRRQLLPCSGVNQTVYVHKPVCWTRENVVRLPEYDPGIPGLRAGGDGTEGGWLEPTMQPCSTQPCCLTSYKLVELSNSNYDIVKTGDPNPPFVDCQMIGGPNCENTCQ